MKHLKYLLIAVAFVTISLLPNIWVKSIGPQDQTETTSYRFLPPTTPYRTYFAETELTEQELSEDPLVAEALIAQYELYKKTHVQFMTTWDLYPTSYPVTLEEVASVDKEYEFGSRPISGDYGLCFPMTVNGKFVLPEPDKRSRRFIGNYDTETNMYFFP